MSTASRLLRRRSTRHLSFELQSSVRPSVRQRARARRMPPPPLTQFCSPPFHVVIIVKGLTNKQKPFKKKKYLFIYLFIYCNHKHRCRCSCCCCCRCEGSVCVCMCVRVCVCR